MKKNIISFDKCKLDTMWPIKALIIFYSSHIKKKTYTRKYIAQKLINQFFDQVEYPM